MQILVEIGNEEFFHDNSLIAMGFVAAALEIQLDKVVDKAELSVTGLTVDPVTGLPAIVRFTTGEGAESQLLPSYYTFLGRMK